MRKELALILFLLFLAPWPAPAQVTFKIAGLPDDTPLEDHVFLAGNFNGWNPADSSLSIAWKDPAQRTITAYPAAGRLEFKFTRGDWASAEGNADGQFLPNRTLDYRGTPQTVEVVIQSWEDLGQSNRESTAAPNVYVLEERFYIPQLDRHRRILIYLPFDYFSSQERYPVLYMHDGQNLFDATTSFAGEWQVDETLNRLAEEGRQKVIVVGIDNGGGERINELTPYPNPSYGGGRGADYLRFIVETLKPYVDRQYRTLAGAEHTGVMGSSLGGLISMYAAVAHPETFGQAGVLSPSFWWSDQIYYDASRIDASKDQDIYLLASELESQSMRAQMEAMYNTLRSAGVPDRNIRLKITGDGAHSEWYWARELPEVLRWLYRKKAADTFFAHFDQVVIKPNRTFTKLKVLTREIPENLEVKWVDENGREIPGDGEVKGKKILLSGLPAEARFLKIKEDDRLLTVLEIK